MAMASRLISNESFVNVMLTPGLKSRMQFRWIRSLQDRLARAVGLATQQRIAVFAAMLSPRSGEPVGYWLQLLMAATLATLGLALDSTAVVIGAMLIAPLMKPIVELAMGLATGSAPLVFRAGGRSVASIIAVIAAAAAISFLLPFHDVTRELAARTAPSLIDLFVAAACALVGAYATIFSTSDMASTAAGTSIGISLVPPLCTLGYGISTGDQDMAVGAGLLFTANIAGILTLASVVFISVGFGQVEMSDTAEPQPGLALDLARRWSRESRRLGMLSRLVFPLLLLGGIYFPLRRAVSDMSRRSAVRQELGDLLERDRAHVTQSSIEFDAAGVAVRIVLVGSAQAAKDLESRVRRLLAQLDEHAPRISVWAVPDASSLGALAARLDQLPPPAPELPAELARQPIGEIEKLVTEAWPTSAGTLVDVRVAASESGLRLDLTSLGVGLGAPGKQLLARTIAPKETIAIEETVLAAVVAPLADSAGWLVRALWLMEQVRQYDHVWVCITVPARPPPPPRRGVKPREEDPQITLIRDLVAKPSTARPRVGVVEGDSWSAIPKLEACAPATESPPVSR